ncbi:MAG TPA: hypothetical protein VLC09_17155, partial [Polyangiaceae bacterium]|nr:hypothetical protein [Polyangiaceae bacterium]
QQGGYALERHHPFLKRAFLPVRLRIEARDADGIDGPNWGKSAVITLTPEPIGAERARRYEALQRYRSDLVATLVAELRSNHLSRERALSARGEARAALAKSLDALRERLAETEGAARSLQFLEGQAELLAAPRSDQSTLEASVLATDALLRQLARKDAEATAVDLSGALEEIELAARALLEVPERAGAREGLQDQLTMAAEGARRLSRLGSLGADLGELALGDLARLDAVVAERSYERAARVAAHLAARLRHKRPSFGSSGSSSSGGTETGSASGDSSAGSSEGSSAEPSTAPSEFSELGKQLDELAREHASGLDALERLLDEARRAATDDTSADQRSEAAEALRHALRNLPSVGEGPGTASSEAALGRGHGEAAAAALEGGDRERVLLRAKEADAALERAERAAEAGAWDVRGDDVRQARRALKDAIAAAERGASPSSRGSNPADSGRAAQRERDLAERAERLAQRGRSGEAPLPSESTEALRRAARAMRQAAEALEAGESERGLRTAERAQRELEDAFGEPSESKRGGEGSDGRELASEEVGVPTERKDAGRSFRERVQRGLSRESGALAPAVARYAEELQ